MIDNAGILSKLSLYAKLAELYEKNPFRYKAFSTAAFNLKKVKEPYSEMSKEALLAIQGVGKSVVDAINEIIATDTFTDLQELLEITPEGIVQMLKIKGLGPKKVSTIWHELQIDTVADLLDASRQNRLVEVKGFGLKTQADIIRAIEFSFTANGKWHFARMLEPATHFLEGLKRTFIGSQIEFCGEFRRQCEIIEKIEILTTASQLTVQDYLQNENYEILNNQENCIQTLVLGQFPLSIFFTNELKFNKELFEKTGSSAHLESIEYSNNPMDLKETEEEYYHRRKLNFVLPEQREGLFELEPDFPKEEFIEFWHLKGVLHNHTTYSDGLNTLEEMAEFAKSEKYEYLGICDHSKSAGYANGLSEERLLLQMKEIDALNEKMAPFKIFKGVESDILNDGRLDYPDDILKLLDFVVASIHSNLKMNQDKAHERLIKAIENLYTTILGHPTGRLLLIREGYPIDHKYIIDACAANQVVIELNAHPYRLDIDWRWIYYAQNKGVLISINPDAHEKSGYHDMYFGTMAARKGGLLTSNTLNALNRESFEAFLESKKRKSMNLA